MEEHQNIWDTLFPKFLMAFKSAVNESNGMTSLSIVFEVELRITVKNYLAHLKIIQNPKTNMSRTSKIRVWPNKF